MHYEIYIPGVRGANPQHLIDVGLADHVERAEFLDEATGPDGAGGVIVAWRKPGQTRMGFQPVEQKWIPAVGRGDLLPRRYWLGVWTHFPPAPSDLARTYQQPGMSIVFGNGHAWLLPKPQELDAQMRLADDGTWRFEPQRQFHQFWIEFLRWGEFFLKVQEGDEIDFGQAAAFVLQALQINYRLVPELVNELDLFSTHSVKEALFAVLRIGQ